MVSCIVKISLQIVTDTETQLILLMFYHLRDHHLWRKGLVKLHRPLPQLALSLTRAGTHAIKTQRHQPSAKAHCFTLRSNAHASSPRPAPSNQLLLLSQLSPFIIPFHPLGCLINPLVPAPSPYYHCYGIELGVDMSY